MEQQKPPPDLSSFGSDSSSQSFLRQRQGSNPSLPTVKIDKDTLLLKVEIEDYLELKSSRVVTIAFNQNDTVRQALLYIAKRGSIALNLDEALHNYVLYVPNFEGTGKGIIMNNDRTLYSYGLKNKDNAVLKHKNTIERESNSKEKGWDKKSPPGMTRRISMFVSSRSEVAPSTGFKLTNDQFIAAATKSRRSVSVVESNLEHIVESSSLFGVPIIVHKGLEFLEARTQDPTLFKTPGDDREIQTLLRQFETGEDVEISKATSVNTVVELLKFFLGSLAEPLFTYVLYDTILVDSGFSSSDEAATAKFKETVRLQFSRLPLSNRTLIARLMDFLHKVSRHFDQNK